MTDKESYQAYYDTAKRRRDNCADEDEVGRSYYQGLMDAMRDNGLAIEA